MNTPTFEEEYPLIPIERINFTRYNDEAGIFVLASKAGQNEKPTVVFVGSTMESLSATIQAILQEPRIQRHNPSLFAVRIYRGVEVTNLPMALARLQQQADRLIEQVRPIER